MHLHLCAKPGNMCIVGVFLEDILKSVCPARTKLYMEMTANHLIYPMKPKVNVDEFFFLLALRRPVVLPVPPTWGNVGKNYS